MTAQAQAKAVAAAKCAGEGITALLTYAPDGGPIEEAAHYDMVYPLVTALRTTLEAVREANGSLDSDDGQLISALIHWIEA